MCFFSLATTGKLSKSFFFNLVVLTGKKKSHDYWLQVSLSRKTADENNLVKVDNTLVKYIDTYMHIKVKGWLSVVKFSEWPIYDQKNTGSLPCLSLCFVAHVARKKRGRQRLKIMTKWHLGKIIYEILS